MASPAFSVKMLAFCLFVCFLSTGAETLQSSRPLGFGRTLKSQRICSGIETGTDHGGGDIFSTPIKNVSGAGECCELCLTEPGCMGYIYRPDHKHCWPKRTITAASPCPECVFSSVIQVTPMTCGWREGLDRKGGNMSGMPVTNVQSATRCCNRCNGTPDCRSYVWHRNSRLCYLKKERTEESPCDDCFLGDVF